MKKIFLSLLAMICLGTLSFAQVTKTPKKKEAPATKTAEVKKAEPAKPAIAAKTKADGTPDMRYKENKDAKAAPAKGPLKKDGTPDMRYKDNKPADKKKGKG